MVELFRKSTSVEERIARLGRRIRQLRKEQSVSQEALAAKASIDRSFMGRIERGDANITVTTVFKVSDALGVQPSSLFD